MRTAACLLVVSLALIPCINSYAQESTPSAACTTAESSSMELHALLQAYTSRSGKRFTVHRDAPATVAVGNIDLKSLNLPMLQRVLANNGLAARSTDEGINVVPDSDVRARGLRVTTEKDSGISPDEWVTEIWQLKHISAIPLVPVLRPMVPQQGHLAAVSDDSNSLIIVDRYANVRRLARIVAELDRPGRQGKAP